METGLRWKLRTTIKSNGRFIVLDGIRGIAAFAIFAYHLYLRHKSFSDGFHIFVDFFFVLSGFVLAPQLFMGNRNSSKKFLMNRILRLYPMLVPLFLARICIQRVPYFEAKFNSQVFPYTTYIAAFFLLQVFLDQ